MGLEFGIQKRRKGKAYENMLWDTVALWCNCYDIKEIFSKTIEFNDTYTYPISIGAMQVLVNKLSDRLQEIDFNDMNGVNEYSTSKLLRAISDLSNIMHDAIEDYQNGIEYDYQVFDSF